MNKKRIVTLSIVILLIFMVIFLMSYSIKIENGKTLEKINVDFSRCIDGDTAVFRINKQDKKFRFLGIDAPEADTEFGKVVSKYTCNLLENAKEIKIEYDEYGKTIDKYNRELAWIYVDGEMLENILLEKGYAKVKYIYANYNYLNELYKNESIAQNKRQGLWENYNEKVYNDYYTVTFNYSYKNEVVSVLENNHVSNIKNPYKYGCRFIGWKNGNYLFDLSTKIKNNYVLNASFDC